MRLLFCLLILLAAPALASVEADFRAAREAYQQGRAERFDKHAARIPAGHLLSPYADFWRLKLDGAAPAELEAFLERHPQGPLADRVHADLARRHGRNQEWAGFNRHYPALGRSDPELMCLDLQSRLQAGAPGTDQAIRELWLGQQDLPSACEPLFTAALERGVLGQDELHARLRLALDRGNLRLAREVDARLAPEARMDADALARAARNGEQLIAAPGPRRAQREAALHALAGFARLDPEGAARLWQAHQDQYPDAERQYGWGQIALHAARRHDPRALAWFQRAGAVLTELQAQWKARAALRAGNWVETYQAIQAMPESSREDAVWRYWKARALKGLNLNLPANTLFAQLSREIHYYGLLALEELPPRLEARPANYLVTPDDLKAAQANAGLQRALLLRRLGLIADAEAEWRWALRGLDDRQLLAAAELALRDRWHDRAIITADQTRELHNFDLRYIAPYRDLASAYAAENGLDESWVYGLIRQESRFVDYARSGAGARGLMQIMPATARWIAHQLGLKKNAHNGVGEPDTNLRFGTYYLKTLYDSLDQSPVLASAGYNAGPGRARRWQAEAPLEGAVYVEGIPFAETREYVKKVLANAMFYRDRFGGTTRPLKERLGLVPARNTAPAGEEEKE